MIGAKVVMALLSGLCVYQSIRLFGLANTYRRTAFYESTIANAIGCAIVGAAAAFAVGLL